jgi:hypothetical protein
MRRFITTTIDTGESVVDINTPRGIVGAHDTLEEAENHIQSLRLDREYQIFEAVCNFVPEIKRIKVPII